MAVLVEALSVIVRRSAINARFRGGWAAFEKIIPNHTGCADDDLARVGFMSAVDVGGFISILTEGGLIFQRDNIAVDFAIVDQLDGPVGSCPWLKYGPV